MEVGVDWQLQEAKQRFSELVRRALDEGPQLVTRHGQGVAVVVSVDEYERLRASRPSFKEFLLSAPDLGALEIDRSREGAREVDL
jgi:prevent-host-death family protein